MTDNVWSPFDPEWYKVAFDKYTSTADELFRRDEIIGQGFTIPDVDGSKSSVFRRSAVLNNTFDEEVLRETLRDIYIGQNRLAAMNHDNTGFYQWHGTMSDVKPVPNTKYADIVIPAENFITQSGRNKYKLSQFYRKWFSITDLLNNWDVFGWTCLMFVNQRVYSEYQFRIDDQQMTIRFAYYEQWKTNDYPIQIYKFATGWQKRVLVSKEVIHRNNWKLPLSYFDDSRIGNRTKCIGCFNRINGTELERIDGRVNVDVMGENLEFLHVVDGCLDLVNISDGNRRIINSERQEWIWLTLIHPRHFHEFPILLPADLVYRPYQPEYARVYITDFGENKLVHESDSQKVVYVNLDDNMDTWNDGWKSSVRPMVLSDAFQIPYGDPYEQILDELNEIRRLSSIVADRVESLRASLNVYDENEFVSVCQSLDLAVDDLHDAHYRFLDSRRIEINEEYEARYREFKSRMSSILEEKNGYIGFSSPRGFWPFVSQLIDVPNVLCEKFDVANTIRSIGSQSIWESDHTGEFYYSHPVDTSDIWCFEYDKPAKTWKPVNVSIQRQFPDVYTITPDGDITGRIFKAFIFYSDAFTVGRETKRHVAPSPSWDQDVAEYELNQRGNFRNIYLEKFYWMAIRSVYKGLIQTHYRWELIEYIRDNAAYDRFNQLFLNSFEPYFKLGLATYSKSDEYLFSLDYSVDKFNERLSTEMNGFKRVTNFELYLDKSVVRSYFDYITKITSDWDYSGKLIRRPRSTFDSFRLLPTLLDSQQTVTRIVNNLTAVMNQCLRDIQTRGFNIDSTDMTRLLDAVAELDSNAKKMYQKTLTLDKDIYSITDVKDIRSSIQNHLSLSEAIVSKFSALHTSTLANSVSAQKAVIIDEILRMLTDEMWPMFTELARKENQFDIDAFMKRADDPEHFDEPGVDDFSLIGYINRFLTGWSERSKKARNDLHLDLVEFWAKFAPAKSYTLGEIVESDTLIEKIANDLSALRAAIFNQWGEEEPDDSLVNRLEYVEDQISSLSEYVHEFTTDLMSVIDKIDALRMKLVELNNFNLSSEENGITLMIDHTLDAFYTHLGYVYGKNSYKDTLNVLELVRSGIREWKKYVAAEQDLFDTIERVSSPENGFLTELAPYNDRLSRMISYLDSVDVEYVPDEQTPSYSWVYSLDAAEQLTGGLLNETGDVVYVPGMGVFTVTDSEDGTSLAVQMEDCRTTSFRSPMWKSNPYDSITSGNGMGITVKPTAVSSIRIRDDTILQRYVDKIVNILFLINRDMYDVNPYNNSLMTETIQRITEIQTDWDSTMERVGDFISDDAKEKCAALINSCLSARDSLTSLVNARSNCVLEMLIIDMDEFIHDSRELAQSLSGYDDIYVYHENRLIDSLKAAIKYYGTGMSWNDADELLSICQKVRYELRLFWRKIMRDRNMYQMQEQYDSLLSVEERIESSIGEIYSAREAILSNLESIREAQSRMDGELTRDLWYRVSTVGVANSGSGYKPGDVVEVVPQLSVDASGNVMNADPGVVLNDRLFVQVVSTDTNGAVTKAVPLIDYAIPYQLYGRRETDAKMGNGTGLILSFYSTLVTANDSTLMLDPSCTPPRPNKFDDNDLFAFKFQNIYDVPIEYEVFLGGKQLRDYVVRHIDSTGASKVDAIYLNANEVMKLASNSIYEKAEHYFVYKLDEISLLDGGAGYTEGQEIRVSTDQAQLRLTVLETDGTPFHRIKTVEPLSTSIEFNGADPTADVATTVDDSLNVIDDEYHVGLYDAIPSDGEEVKISPNLPDEYSFIRKHHDGTGNRNSGFTSVSSEPTKGIPLLGHRYDWENEPSVGIYDTQTPTEPFISDSERVPDMSNPRSDYQPISEEWIHNVIGYNGMEFAIGEDNRLYRVDDLTDQPYYTDDLTSVSSLQYSEYESERIINHTADIVVPNAASLPKHMDEWAGATAGKCAIVESDENNENRRTLYRIRSFLVTGYIVYEDPEYVDKAWDYFEVDWTKSDFYPDMPTVTAQYPSEMWWKKASYKLMKHDVDDGLIERVATPTISRGTYIHDVTLDDLAVWNYSTKSWEDLNSGSWSLEVWDEGYGFRLYYRGDESFYSKKMRLYMKKVPRVLQKNAAQRANATFRVHAYIKDEVDRLSKYTEINVGKHLRIRKLFPYEQKESYTVGEDIFAMNFKLAPYIHFRNEIHAKDIVVYNKSAAAYEDPLDPSRFELRIRDPKSTNHGFETNTIIAQTLISDAGTGFYDGPIWGYNQAYGVHIFGHVKTDFLGDGHIEKLTITSCPNPPTDDTVLEFKLYQRESQIVEAIAIVEFQTQKSEISEDGWIHNVTDPMARLTDEFMLIPKYSLDEGIRYEIRIDKNPKTWTFISPRAQIFPTFNISEPLNVDNLYVLTEEGRLPMINPSTEKPTLYVKRTREGCEVTLMDICKSYERLEIHKLPYTIRSVYTQRRIPENGYVNIGGRLNKPLSKKYYEFWVNGRLLDDEVTIISPTKLFFHGLKSRRNLEIIEVNRNPDEYFSNVFLEARSNSYGRIAARWNFTTYLDAALQGDLEGDNYTPEEQAMMLAPVWYQVPRGDMAYPDYPENQDMESDILTRVDDYSVIVEIMNTDDAYQFIISDVPSIESIPLNTKALMFEHMGVIPMTEENIIEMLNDEWKDEIGSSLIEKHVVISKDEWYGMTVQMYDEYGNQVFSYNDAAYIVGDSSLLRINSANHTVRIIRNLTEYDVT